MRRTSTASKKPTDDRHDKLPLLRQDWGDAWEDLPEAPPLVPRPDERYRLATEVAEENPTTLIFRVGVQFIVAEADGWSTPLQLRFVPTDDGVYDLMVRPYPPDGED